MELYDGSDVTEQLRFKHLYKQMTYNYYSSVTGMRHQEANLRY